MGRPPRRTLVRLLSRGCLVRSVIMGIVHVGDIDAYIC